MNRNELIEKMCRADCAACHIPPDDWEENENGFRVYNWEHGKKRMEALLELVETALIDTPSTDNFLRAVKLESAHQRKRWPEGHDTAKSVDDWLWLIAYLVTKATQAERNGDREKYLHHIITAAAALAQWHEHASATTEAST